MSFPVWHGKGQEVNKLKSYAVNQLKVTRNTFRDPIIAAVTVSMIAVLLEKRKPLVRPGVQLSFSVESLMLKSILSINIKLRPVNCSFN